MIRIAILSAACAGACMASSAASASYQPPIQPPVVVSRPLQGTFPRCVAPRPRPGSATVARPRCR